MLSVNSINSQVNFSGSKKAPKEAKKDKPKLSKLGGRTLAQKYTQDGKPIDITTANIGIIAKDYILDHAIEIGLAIATFAAIALKGRSMMNGVTGSAIDAAKEMTEKNSEKLSITKKLSAFINQTIENVKQVQSLQKKDAEGLKENADGFIKTNVNKAVKEDSVIDRLAKKADDEKSLFAKFVKKVSKNPNAGSEDVKAFFAKKLGITRGADAIDDVVVLGTAGGVSNVVHSVTDAVTDLNDENIAARADEINKRYEEAESPADIRALKRQERKKTLEKIGKAAGEISEIM